MPKRKQKGDFQKVKIKAGKRLPKCLNEFNPNFTAKKIKLNPIPKTSQSSKELIKLLTNGNMNTSTKVSFFERLHKVLQAELNNGSNQAGEQIQALCKYLRDPDKKCRSKAIDCLKCCLNIVSSCGDESINPVMHVLFTHLNTGFTVFDESIRDDCKKFFEYLLGKSDNSLNNHLMRIFIKIIEKYTADYSMDYKTYNLLNIFIRNRQEYFRNIQNSDAKKTEDVKHKPFVIQQSDKLETIPLHYPSKLAERYQNLQDFSLSSELNPTMNIKDKFLQVTRKMILKDIGTLKCKKSEHIVNQLLFQLNLQQ